MRRQNLQYNNIIGKRAKDADKFISFLIIDKILCGKSVAKHTKKGKKEKIKSRE